MALHLRLQGGTLARDLQGGAVTEALHYYDYSAAEFETVYLNHAYEDVYLLTS